MALPDLQCRLAAYLDEDADADSLPTLCERLAAETAETVDIAVLLDWMQHYRCDPVRRSQAIRAIRAALRLPTIPGPVCRQ